MTRTHAPRPDATPEQRLLQLSWCGALASRLATTGDEVTCKRCLKLAARLVEQEAKGKLRRVSWDEVVREIARVLGGAPVEPYPALEPASYRSMRCRIGSAHCSCVYCQIDDANVNAKAKWEAEQIERPHRKWACVFGSISAALTHAANGHASLSSSLGRMQSRAKELEALGTAVQTTLRTDRDSIEIRNVDKSHDVERAVWHAFDEEQARRGLPQAHCVLIVLSAYWQTDPVRPEDWAEATGLTPKALRELWLHGRRQAEASLAVSGYVPEPRQRVRRRARGDRWVAEEVGT